MYHSRILLLTINDTLKSVVFSMYSNNNVGKEHFNGEILITDLNGFFLNGYRVTNGNVISQFIKGNFKSPSSLNKSFSDNCEIHTDDDPHCICNIQYLNEIIIPPKSGGITYLTLADIYGDHGGGSSSTCEVNCNSWSYDSGGGSSEPVVEIDPCAQIKGLLDYDSTENINLKSNINWLKDKVNAAVNNQEAGVEVKKVMNPDETFKYEFTQVSSKEQFSVSLLTGYSFVGAFHSHPSDGYAMFSFGDIRFLLSVYDGASSKRKEEAFHGLVCKDAAGNTNTYMLKIENIESLRTQINSVWGSEKYSVFQTEEERIKAIHKDQAIKYSESNGNLEKSFLEQFKDFGIELFKADPTTDHFDKLTLNNSTVTPTPCN